MVPGGQQGTMQVLHHGFGASANGSFSLIFAQGNLEDCTIFKTLPRVEAVAQIGKRTGRRSGSSIAAPSLSRMVEAESEKEFTSLEPEGNEILEGRPNHLLIAPPPQVFIMLGGARTVSLKELAFKIVQALASSGDDDSVDLQEKETEREWVVEELLATLWASARGLLLPIALADVPETPLMNQLIRTVKDKLGNGTVPHVVSPISGDHLCETRVSLELMATSSQNLVSILNRIQDGTEDDKIKKEAEKFIMKAMGPTQRALFLALCTTDTTDPPAMTGFMTNLTSSKTPQKAISLIQSETRDWEGTFSVGGMHRLLSNGFLSQEINRANPGGRGSIFMFHPRTVELHGKGRNDLLREYLGMDVDESTLEYYSKQGYFAPSNPHDLRVQLQTALDILELLTCPQSIATVGLHYILEPKRSARMTTILGDRFKAKKDIGAQFCYTLDRSLQNFFDKVMRWRNMADDGNPVYLLDKAENLLESIEDGKGLNTILPVTLLASALNVSKKRDSPARTSETASKKAKKDNPAEPNPAKDSKHVNDETRSAWLLPRGTVFTALFRPQMPGLKGWSHFTDNRLAWKPNRPVLPGTHVRPLSVCRRMHHVMHPRPRQSLGIHRGRNLQRRQTLRRTLPLRPMVIGLLSPRTR